MRVAYKGCPLCGAKAAVIREADCTGHPLYQESLPPTIRWLQCAACEHVYTDGYWSDEAFRVLSEKIAEPVQVFNAADFERQRHVSARIVDRVMAHRGPALEGERWLDVGCGSGALPLTAAEYGFFPVACDIRPSTVDALLAIGLEVHLSNFIDGALPSEPVSVISMADVLEHMPDPRGVLLAAHDRLTANGLLFVSCPATFTPLWDMMDAAGTNPYWGEIEHYHNFTRERLAEMMKETGFEPLSYGVSERYRCCMEIVARAV